MIYLHYGSDLSVKKRKKVLENPHEARKRHDKASRLMIRKRNARLGFKCPKRVDLVSPKGLDASMLVKTCLTDSP